MLHLSVISTKETLITFASIGLMASLLFLWYICLCADKTRHQFQFQTNDNNYTYSRTAKNYPAIVPTPLYQARHQKLMNSEQEALLMPRAITKLPIRPAIQLPGRRHPVHPRLGAEGARGR